MSKKKSTSQKPVTDHQPASQNSEHKAGNSVKCLLQYVKDLSFENPNAPGSIISLKEQPKISFNLDVNAKKINDHFEVALTILARDDAAKDSENKVFICELTYAGLFEVKPASEAMLKPLLLVHCPNLLFPFARRIISDTTRDGGYPPLMMENINVEHYQSSKNNDVSDKTKH